MKKKLNKAIVAGTFLILAGCQSNQGPTLFSSYPKYPAFSSNSSNMTLIQAIQNALMNSGDPVVAQVHVETNQNAIMLSGYVKKIRQSDMAEQIARQVSGSQNIQNNIIVRQ